MADLDNVGRWAGDGQGSSRIPDTYPVLEFIELLCVAVEPRPAGTRILRGELVLDRFEFGIVKKRLSRDGSRSSREIPKQAMMRKIKII